MISIKSPSKIAFLFMTAKTPDRLFAGLARVYDGFYIAAYLMA